MWIYFVLRQYMYMDQRIQELEKELAESLSTKDREVTRLKQEVEQLRAILVEMEKQLAMGDQPGAGQSVSGLRIQQELDTVRVRNYGSCLYY